MHTCSRHIVHGAHATSTTKSTTEDVPYSPRSYLTTARPLSRSSPTHTTDTSRLHASAPISLPTCSLDESHPILVGSAAKPLYLFKFASRFHSPTTSSLSTSRPPCMSLLHPTYIRPIPHPIISRRISLCVASLPTRSRSRTPSAEEARPTIVS